MTCGFFFIQTSLKKTATHYHSLHALSEFVSDAVKSRITQVAHVNFDTRAVLLLCHCDLEVAGSGT